MNQECNIQLKTEQITKYRILKIVFVRNNFKKKNSERLLNTYNF